MSVLNASPESFVHKALKDEQIECIHRMTCHGREVLAVLPTGLGKSTICQLISKVLFHVGLQSGTVPSPSSASETYSLQTKQED